MDARAVLNLVAAVAPQRDFTFVGIDGRGGAGKSTLAALIPEAQTVGTDDFWDGENFDVGRLGVDVFEPLLAGCDACFATWDWDAGRLGDERTVTPTGVVVVEGVRALDRMLRDAYDVRVWVEAPDEVRLVRGLSRDGEGARTSWVERWMPMEDRYVERDNPGACADIVVDGG